VLRAPVAGNQQKKDGADKRGQGTFMQAMKAVSWAFFGVRKHTDHDNDAATLTMGQVIVAGLIGAALFVVGVLLLVKFATS
jgi:hypothetical protein